jgi:thiamine-monophosphate kinase
MVHRSGARPGDRVMVSGTIGDAALGLHVLKGGRIAEALAGDEAGRAMLVARYRVPQPRHALAPAVPKIAHLYRPRRCAEEAILAWSPPI